jgi:hypothetical protein
MEAELPPPHTLPATTTERELDEPRIIADNPGVDVPGIIHVKTYEPGWREHINNAKEFARKHHKNLSSLLSWAALPRAPSRFL